MIIKYQFLTETVEIEVDDDWGCLVIDMDRMEYNNDHKETRRHVSLDAALYEGEVFVDESANLEKYADSIDLQQAISTLTDHQQRIINGYYFDGLTYVELGRELGISEASVRKAADRALKALKKLL